jgi:hypothetical protein
MAVMDRAFSNALQEAVRTLAKPCGMQQLQSKQGVPREISKPAILDAREEPKSSCAGVYGLEWERRATHEEIVVQASLTPDP